MEKIHNVFVPKHTKGAAPEIAGTTHSDTKPVAEAKSDKAEGKHQPAAAGLTPAPKA